MTGTSLSYGLSNKKITKEGFEFLYTLEKSIEE